MADVGTIEVECSRCGHEHTLPADHLPVLHCEAYTCNACCEGFDVSVDRAYSILATYVLEVVRRQ